MSSFHDWAALNSALCPEYRDELFPCIEIVLEELSFLVTLHCSFQWSHLPLIEPGCPKAHGPSSVSRHLLCHQDLDLPDVTVTDQGCQ